MSAPSFNLDVLVRKSNHLVEARYDFSVWEFRLFTMMVTMIKYGDADFRNYRINLKDLVQQFGLNKQKGAYDFLRDAANSLLRKEVSILHEVEPGEVTEFRTHLIIGAVTQVKGSKLSYIEVSFHPALKPHLLALKSEYTIYGASNVANLPSSYSVRIYELLKQYEKIGHRTLSIQELKEMIGARVITWDAKGKEKVKDTCAQYSSLNQRILKPAQRHLLENTDICFEFEALKDGRKVTRLKFIIMRNPNLAPVSQVKELPSGSNKMKEEVRDAQISRIYVQVQAHVDEATVRRWVDNHPEEQIQYAINYTMGQVKAGKGIQNVGGYLNKMVTTDALMTARKAEEKKRSAAEAKAHKRKKELALTEKQYDEVVQNIQLKQESTIRGIFDRHPTAKPEIFETAKKRRHSGYNGNRTNAENMADGLFRATFMNIVRKRYPEHFSEIAELENWSKRLRGKISRLKG